MADVDELFTSSEESDDVCSDHEDSYYLSSSECESNSSDSTNRLGEFQHYLQVEDGKESSTHGSSNIKNRIHKMLNKIRDCYSIEHLDLRNHFADVHFLIDGEGLFVETLTHPDLSWEFGGQPLHLLYLYERFLHKFLEKEANFKLLFFKGFDSIWKCVPSVAVTRMLLIEHFQRNTNITVIYEFMDVFDPMFQQYLTDESPSFMLTSDDSFLLNLKDIFHEDLKENLVVSFFLENSNVYLWVVVAFISGIVFDVRKVNCYFNNSDAKYQKLYDKVERSICKDSSLQNVYRNMFSPTYEDLSFVPKQFGELKNFNNKDVRILLTCQALNNVMKMQANMAFFIQVYALHLAILLTLPLKYRAQELPELPEMEKIELKKFWNYMCSCLKYCLTNLAPSSSGSFSKIGDLFDGRLFVKIFYLCKKEMKVQLNKKTELLYMVLVKGLNLDEFNNTLPVIGKQNEKLCTKGELKIAKSKERSINNDDDFIINVSSVLMDQYVGDILSSKNLLVKDINDKWVKENVLHGYDFEEITHWHCKKLLSDDYNKTKDMFTEKPCNDPFLKKRLEKTKQKYVSYLEYYGHSLEGTSDPKCRPIIVQKKEKESFIKVSKSAQRIIENNINRRQNETKEKDKKIFDDNLKIIKDLKKKKDYKGSLYHIKQLLSNTVDQVIKKKILLLSLQVQVGLILQKHKECNTQDSNDFVIFIEDLKVLLTDFKKELSDYDKNKITKCCLQVGLGEIIEKEGLSVKEKYKKKDNFLTSIETARFQLEHMGALLSRECRTDPDPRVDHFIPDTWQREMFDAIDTNRTTLIVAPTSSGKTYASYYCIEKVLRESNDGVIVYVAPTKALVNQIHATVYARFGHKKMPAGRAVCGIFTRDYRHHALTCQVLVTVPQCFEILLLGPQRQDWAKKIRFVIFDEIHCLDSEHAAEVWEHLILLIYCPFLALSATIQNPEGLCAWLQKIEDYKQVCDKQNGLVKRAIEYKVALITYKERHNDLINYRYIPETGYLQHVHPVSLFKLRDLQIRTRFPEHFTLSPDEVLQLYDAMKNICSKDNELERLEPGTEFRAKTFLSKEDCRKYENKLKDLFIKWIRSGKSSLAEKVIVNLKGTSDKQESFSFNPANEINRHRIGQYLVPLLEKMKNTDKFPAIFFCYDRKLCEWLTSYVAKMFNAKEEQYKQSKLMKHSEKIKKQKLKEVRRRRDKTKELKAALSANYAGDRLNSFEDLVAESIEHEKKHFLFEKKPLPDFTYANYCVIDRKKTQFMHKRLSNALDTKSLNKFASSVCRGISYHHGGVDNKRRSTVEMLFRAKFLNIVIATGTLALGIHMPCKTVVFLGNSQFLTPLNYRQMSGRAGRRGFDFKGEVIFFGLPSDKIAQLMSADLPKLIGNFPVSVTLVLRLLLMVAKSEDTQDALHRALNLLKHPLICQSNSQLKEQLKQHFMFSVQFLIRECLLDSKGVPQGLARLAIHLHYKEPGNFLFVYFLKSKALHTLCKNSKKKSGKYSSECMKELVLILCHLFTNVPVYQNRLKHLYTPSSKVVLDELPEPFRQLKDEYNKRVLNVFDMYLRNIGSCLTETEEDIMLPLSRVIFDGEENIGEDDETIEGELVRSAYQNKVCSAFVATSGHNDENLYDHENTVSKLQQRIYTDSKTLPIFKDDCILNAYASDFFLHGSKKCIIRENGIMEGVVWTLLKDFNLTIKSISIALSELADDMVNDDVVKAFAQLDEEYSEKFKKEFPQ
ncbi:LOW QUALITY PROTEIN: putative ATP-dependent RNA helicase DDX60 [Tachypleus tridentatus]|uniref:LOW QUALITY PROTEIN: putative ATP-dependent RNA helicase DDX60 n=1 Tax=Tachypleus tridentatus TaxID=6853 RepID=UPI003FCF9FDD